jgi:RNA methyltransferase, TrmH family
MPGSAESRTRIVQSRHNARVKELRAALRHPSGQTSVGLEGVHLVEEALRSRGAARQAGLQVETIFVREGAEHLLGALPQAALEEVPEVLVVAAEALESASTTESPQGIAALVTPPVWAPEALFRTGVPLVLVLDGLQDPGNVGTLLRSAEAFGATGVLALPGTANFWNPKTLRASMGSALRMPAVRIGEGEALALFAGHGLTVFAAGAQEAAEAAVCDLAVPLALLIGNEGAGLSPTLLAAAHRRVTLPCPGPVESLNAAVAGSILLYECSRQRRGA